MPRAAEVMPVARDELGPAVEHELNLCQIEVGTDVCTTLAGARVELAGLRRKLAAAASREGCAVAALGTHPFGSWEDQRVDLRNERFRRMDDMYGIVARQQVICGCHVHVGIDDRDLAIATMNRTRPWLPILLALSGNSPFWQGADSGYSSYRLQVWQRWPTSGMPPTLASAEAYDELVTQLRSIDAIKEPTSIYWYVRPSARFPTLEFRACDVCLDVEDTVTVAGLIRALAWTCAQRAMRDEPELSPRLEILDAAMWRAARYGLSSTLVSPSVIKTRPAAAVVEEMLDFVAEGLEEHRDAEAVREGVAAILRRGNGAVHQRSVHAERGDLRAVVAEAVDVTSGG